MLSSLISGVLMASRIQSNDFVNVPGNVSCNQMRVRYSLKHCVPTLNNLLKKQVVFLPDCVGPGNCLYGCLFVA